MLDLSNVNLVKYMSIPYIWGGSSFSGADCYGLVVLFYKEQFKLNIFDYKNLASQFEGDVSNSSAFSDNCEDEFVKIKEKDLITTKQIELPIWLKVETMNMKNT